ncbi:DUF4390 domain-containing protein [Methylophilaceae bacterium]|jgi:hypothetical protein|nr:DUF4390 domain-containing protein [Methylophilaceae bacterium]|tara:strand:- start:4879 stop:5448 length:570 start_codon:yes stop_codon:yes gene_type:complete
MPSLKKINIIVIVIVILSIAITNTFTFSDKKKILIKDVLINKNIDSYFVSFDQEIHLDYLIIEAVDKGIPLVFKIVLKVVETNEVWPTKTIKREVMYYQIKYKALRKIYNVVDLYGKSYEYKNMDEAIKKMLKVENLKFSFIDKNKNYELWLNVSLERKKLPKPLQVNYFDTTWNIKSEKSIHKIGKLN